MSLPEPYYEHGGITIYHGDCVGVLREIPSGSVRCCVTSPPYWGLRDYGHDGQIGLEPTPDEYVANMVEVFREVRRVLRDDGTCWVNLGDSYAAGGTGGASAVLTLNGGRGVGPSEKIKQGPTITRSAPPGLKPKDLVGIPWRVAFALQADGWYLRSDIIWHKPNPMPESVTDRPTKAHEYIFLLSKSARYFYDADAVAEGAKDWSSGGPGTGIKETQHYGAGNGGNSGLASIAQRYKDGDAPSTRNARSVWTITTQPFPGSHFAVMPTKLVKPCILAGSEPGDVVLDPFSGAGTVAYVAREYGRRAVGIELNPDYCEIAAKRLAQGVFGFG